MKYQQHEIRWDTGQGAPAKEQIVVNCLGWLT